MTDANKSDEVCTGCCVFLHEMRRAPKAITTINNYHDCGIKKRRRNVPFAAENIIIYHFLHHREAYPSSTRPFAKTRIKDKGKLVKSSKSAKLPVEQCSGGNFFIIRSRSPVSDKASRTTIGRSREICSGDKLHNANRNFE